MKISANQTFYTYTDSWLPHLYRTGKFSPKYHLNEKLIKTFGNKNHLPFKKRFGEKTRTEVKSLSAKYICQKTKISLASFFFPKTDIK